MQKIEKKVISGIMLTLLVISILELTPDTKTTKSNESVIMRLYPALEQSGNRRNVASYV